MTVSITIRGLEASARPLIVVECNPDDRWSTLYEAYAGFRAGPHVARWLAAASRNADLPAGPGTCSDKAEQASGGAIVNIIAYQNDYTSTREELKVIDAATRVKKCVARP